MEQTRRALVFFDLDGTISLDHKPPSALMAEGIRKLRRAGHKAIICTGRPSYRVGPDYEEAIGFDGLITLMGAHVLVDGEVLEDAALSVEDSEAVLNIFVETGASSIFQHSSGGFFFVPGDAPALERQKTPHALYRSLDEVRAAYPKGVRVTKLASHNKELEALGDRKKDLARYMDFYDTNTGWLDLMMKGVSKATALKKVIDYFGWSLEDTYAIGDSENDIDMLAMVGNPIAMGNAVAEVKQHAKYVTKDIQEDGAYWALRHYRLIED